MEIVKKLDLIKGQKQVIDEVLRNYEMGLITVIEMYGQVGDVLSYVETLKTEIKKDYGINSAAIELMLRM